MPQLLLKEVTTRILYLVSVGKIYIHSFNRQLGVVMWKHKKKKRNRKRREHITTKNVQQLLWHPETWRFARTCMRHLARMRVVYFHWSKEIASVPHLTFLFASSNMFSHPISNFIHHFEVLPRLVSPSTDPRARTFWNSWPSSIAWRKTSKTIWSGPWAKIKLQFKPNFSSVELISIQLKWENYVFLSWAPPSSLKAPLTVTNGVWLASMWRAVSCLHETLKMLFFHMGVFLLEWHWFVCYRKVLVQHFGNWNFEIEEVWVV